MDPYGALLIAEKAESGSLNYIQAALFSPNLNCEKRKPSHMHNTSYACIHVVFVFINLLDLYANKMT